MGRQQQQEQEQKHSLGAEGIREQAIQPIQSKWAFRWESQIEGQDEEEASASDEGRDFPIIGWEQNMQMRSKTNSA